MVHTRRRRLAWLFALVLVMGLVALCYASTHVAEHRCCDSSACAICALLRGDLRRGIPSFFGCAAALLLAFRLRLTSFGNLCARKITPVFRKVRMND